MIDITRRLRELADELDEKSTDAARPWPPKGVAIEVDLSNGGKNSDWFPLVSAGNGEFFALDRTVRPLSNYRWRYARAPWDIAPSNSDGPARGWVVTSSGECLWVWRRDLVVGDEFRAISTIVYVEYREDVE